MSGQKAFSSPELNSNQGSELICLTDPSVGQQWEEMVQGEGRQDCPSFMWFYTVLCAHGIHSLLFFPFPHVPALPGYSGLLSSWFIFSKNEVIW